MVAASFLVAWFTYQADQARLLSNFESKTQHCLGQLRETLLLHEQTVKTIAGLFEVSPNLSRLEFDRAVSRYGQSLKEIQAIEWVPLVKQADRERMVSKVRDEGFRNYDFKQWQPDGSWIKKEEDWAEVYAPVYFVFPLVGNEAAFGIDLASNPIRKTALNQARETGQPVATARVNLAQEPEHQAGVLLFVPVYQSLSDQMTQATRRNEILGFAVGVFRVNTAIENAIDTLDVEGLQLRIIDESKDNPQHAILYESDQFVGAFDPTFTATHQHVIGGRDWRFEWSCRPDYLRAQRSWTPVLTALIGVLFASVLGFVLHSNFRNLKKTTAAESELKKQTRSLRAHQFAVDNASAAVFWIRENGSISYANQQAADYLGYSREVLAQMGVCDINPNYLLEAWPGRWQDTKDQGVKSFESTHQRKDGSLYDCKITKHFLSFEGDEFIFETVEDVTEANRAKKALARAQAALDTSADAVLWARRDGTILYVNYEMCQRLQYTRDELLKMSPMDINSELMSLERFQSMFDSVKQANSRTITTKHQRKDKSLVPVEVVAHFLSFEDDEFVCIFARDITERIRDRQQLLEAKHEAEESERRFRDLANSASPLCWVTETDSTCSWLNKRWLEYCGQSLENQVGYGWTETVHPDDRESAKSTYLAAFERQSEFQLEYRLRRSDGEYRWFKVNATPRFDADGKFVGFVGMSFDVHEARLATTALAESEASLRETAWKLEQALLNGNIGLWDWNCQTNEVFYSDTLKLQLGYSTDDQWKTFQALESRIHPNDRASTLKAIDQHLSGRRSIYENTFRLRAADGTYRWIVSRGRADFDKNGVALRMIGINADVTDLRILRDERAALERSNSDLEQFAHVASHDLQEPLRAVTGFLQLLQQKYGGQLDDRANGYIEKSVGGATRMSGLINDLLHFSRVTRDETSFSEVNLNEIVAAAMKELTHAINDSNASIEVDELPHVQGIKPLLVHLFINLFGNAIKYRSKSAPQIKVRCQQIDSIYEIRISDNGIGIEPRHYERIFEMFKRLHHRNEYPGTGIGLSICKRIVERHHGNICVESSLGIGSTFIVTLPTEL